MNQIEWNYFYKKTVWGETTFIVYYWVPMLLLATILGTGDTEWTKVARSLFSWIYFNGGEREQSKIYLCMKYIYIYENTSVWKDWWIKEVTGESKWRVGSYLDVVIRKSQLKRRYFCWALILDKADMQISWRRIFQLKEEWEKEISVAEIQWTIEQAVRNKVRKANPVQILQVLVGYG